MSDAIIEPVDHNPFVPSSGQGVVESDTDKANRNFGIEVVDKAPEFLDPAPALPEDQTKGMSKTQLFLAGAGKRFRDLGRGTAEMHHFAMNPPLRSDSAMFADLLFPQSKREELPPLDQTGVENLMKTTPARFGYVAPDVAGFMAAPNMGVMGNMGAAGLMGAMEPADTLTGHGINAAKSAIPAGALTFLLSRLGKVGGATMGDWGENSGIKRTSDELEAAGIPSTISQLKPKDGFGARQVDAVASLLDKDGKNQAVESIKRAYEVSGKTNDALWKEADNAVSGTTKVIPREFMDGLNSFIKSYGIGVLTTASNTPNRQAAAKLLAMTGNEEAARKILLSELNYSSSGATKFVRRAADYANGMGFSDVRELQKTIGSISGEFNPTKGDVIGDAASGLYSNLYNDLNRWQYNGTNKDAWNKFVAARDDFKSNVLPFEKDWTVAKKAISGQYDKNPSKAMMDITAPGNRDQLTQIIQRLHPDDSKYLMAPLVTADNMRKAISRPFGNQSNPPEVTLPFVGPLEKPISNWLKNKHQEFSSNPVIKSLYFGKDITSGGVLGRIRQGLVGAAGAEGASLPPFSSRAPDQ